MFGKYGGTGNRFRKPTSSSGGGFSGGGYGSFDISSFLNGIFNTLRGIYQNHRALTLGVLAGLFLAFVIIIIIDFFKVRDIANFTPNVTTKIFDQRGELVAELFRQKREVVPLERIPKHLVHAFIAIEDNEFYEHYGVNIKGIVRAFFINIFAGRIRQGGSTITQQLSKILLTSRARSIYRKVKEAIIAVMMEMHYSQGRDNGAVPEPDFPGPRDYGVEVGGSVLLPEARLGAEPGGVLPPGFPALGPQPTLAHPIPGKGH